MQDVLPKISATFEELRKRYPYYISLKRISNKYYVYKVQVFRDKETRRPKTLSEYLGRITEEGIYKKKGPTTKNYLEKAEALITSHGGVVTWSSGKKEVQNISTQSEDTITSELEAKILTILSMNGRASISFIANMVGLSNTATDYHVKKIEEKYGIRYLPEIRVGVLGYSDFIIFVKFEDAIPDVGEIKKELEKYPRIQLVMLTHGKYDLFIYFVAEIEYLTASLEWAAQIEIFKLQQNAFKSHKARWYISTFYRTYGYVPLRNEFFGILKEKVLENNKYNSKPKPGQLLPREYSVLKELNLDGKVEFTNIDKKYGFERSRSDYAYHKLKENKIISRVTLTMQNPPVKYTAIIYADFVKREEFSNNRPKFLSDIIEKQAPINKYALAGDANIPGGGLFILPITYEGELEKVRAQLQSIKGAELFSLIVTDVVLGTVCYRLFDSTYTSQQKILTEEYKKTPVDKINYEETGKIKKQSAKLDIRGLPIETT